MKRILVLTICILLPLCSTMGQNASENEKPVWADGYFKEMQNSYVEVVSAFGYDLKEARDKAVKEAISRRSLATGSESSVSIVNNDVSVSSNHNVIVKARIVDEYIEHSSNGYSVYLLVQTAKNPTYVYEPVSVSNEYAFSARSFVPGMAQFYKGSVGKGTGFICGECLFIGGIVVGQLLSNSNFNKIGSTHDASAKKTYTDNANAWKTVRNISIAGAAAVYVWNVIDGAVAKGKKHVVVGKAALAVMPYADMNSAGMVLAVNF